MRSKVLDLSAKLVLITIMAFSGILVGCYEKDGIDEEGGNLPAIYHIAGVVTDYNYGGALEGVTVKVAGDYAEVTTGENGEFSIKLGAINPAAEGYAVTYTLDGYDTVTKQVFISAVSNGLTSITTANVALRVTGTSSENPAAPPVEGADPTVDEEELNEVLDEISEAAAATVTEEIKEELKNEITAAIGDAAGEITFGETVTEKTEDGQLQVTTPVTFTNSVAAATMTYPYALTTGFEVVGDIEEVANPSSRAIGSPITDPTTIANFKKSVASELNLSEGFSTVPASIQFPVLNGRRVIGYKTISRVETKKHTYLINGKYLSGKASTYTSTTVVPMYDSHDSHDTHGNNNAGGGAGGN